MKYIIIDKRDGDIFSNEFAGKKEAIREAARIWESELTERERMRREAFYVLESANPDEESEDHYDGNIIFNFKH